MKVPTYLLAQNVYKSLLNYTLLFSWLDSTIYVCVDLTTSNDNKLKTQIKCTHSFIHSFIL